MTIGSLGFLLNNEMDDFSSKAGVPNMFGLIQGDANLVGPNKRPLVGDDADHRVERRQALAGARARPAVRPSSRPVANILIGVADFGLDIQQAVNSPRFHHQWLPDRIIMERNRFSPDTVKLLEGRGHTV